MKATVPDEDDAILYEFATRYPRAAAFILRADESPLIRAAVERMNTDDFHAESVFRWLLAPYAVWAPQPDRYDLPDALLAFMANPPTPHWAAIQACTVCGLKCPRLTHADGGQPFATCPACGNPTDQRALFGPPGTVEFDTGWE